MGCDLASGGCCCHHFLKKFQMGIAGTVAGLGDKERERRVKRNHGSMGAHLPNLLTYCLLVNQHVNQHAYPYRPV